MAGLAIPPILPAASPPPSNEAAKARDAAEQFEALLLAQILRTVRETGGGLGKATESGDCATDFAEQQFARLLSQQGGLGLSALLTTGLEKKPATPEIAVAPR